MKSEELISTSWFYKEDNEKIKLNWFLYEFACDFFELLHEDRTRRIADWKATLTDERLAEFCAYYAKRMKRSLVDFLEQETGSIKVYDEYLGDYCHENTRRENGVITKIGSAAWDKMMSSCSVCPDKCLEKPGEFCVYFDQMRQRGH
jgi:hypothetical protein